ncbi:MAG: hypothetical protein JF614_07065 [Acidobacteria bacterium]|nr:hypothetical protein [Acidobacteriota bacterium]
MNHSFLHQVREAAVTRTIPALHITQVLSQNGALSVYLFVLPIVIELTSKSIKVRIFQLLFTMEVIANPAEELVESRESILHGAAGSQEEDDAGPPVRFGMMEEASQEVETLLQPGRMMIENGIHNISITVFSFAVKRLRLALSVNIIDRLPHGPEAGLKECHLPSSS